MLLLNFILDLAMIYIEQPFELSQNIQIVQLNDHIADLTGKIATISGWGRTETKNWAQMLSATKIKIKDNDGRRIVMPNTNGSGSCFGDSGGNNIKIYLIMYFNLSYASEMTHKRNEPFANISIFT